MSFNSIILCVFAAAVVTNANIHPYWAEHNFICNLCTSSVNFMTAGGNIHEFVGCMDGRNEEFSIACKTFREKEADILSMSSAHGMNAQQICESLQMCGDWIDTDFEAKPAWNPWLVAQINRNPESTWTAQMHPRFKDKTLAQIRKSLGSVIDSDHVYQLPIKSQAEYAVVGVELPTNFDARIQWPTCAGVTGHIRDQSECGSCWAFSTTEALNDRICFANVTNSNSRTAFTQLLSVEDTTACCKDVPCGYSAGCSGGMPGAAWKWFTTAGVCTGGDYPDIGKSDSCEPYTLPPCAHGGQAESDYTPCPSHQYDTPKCVSQCTNTGYKVAFSADKHFGKTEYQVRGVNAMMQELVTHGSITANFLVHEDFLSYKSGVYQWTTGQPLGGHAIKIFGYGVDGHTPYWWCANSWNDEWGDKGFFKILKGSDECQIEDQVYAGLPKS